MGEAAVYMKYEDCERQRWDELEHDGVRFVATSVCT